MYRYAYPKQGLLPREPPDPSLLLLRSLCRDLLDFESYTKKVSDHNEHAAPHERRMKEVLKVAQDPKPKVETSPRLRSPMRLKRLTWWQTLLQLLGLLSVVQDQGVKVSRTSDLEFGDGRGGFGVLDLCRCAGLSAGLDGGLLDPRRCKTRSAMNSCRWHSKQWR